MIEAIHISGVATYGTNPAILGGLSTFNYFYGANASGKTTIARVIAETTAFPSCTVTWRASAPLETLVYSRDFIERHFRAPEDLPGIFTLGEQNADIAAEIDERKGKCEQLSDEIAALRTTLGGPDGHGGKVGELTVAEDRFRDDCWRHKLQHDDAFKAAFEGCRGDTKKFKTKVLEERQTNTAELKTQNFLVDKAATVFASGLTSIASMAGIDGIALLTSEEAPILKKKVIGKADVDIAAMIQRLGNSDWVRAGRPFFDVNDGTCPFCQQDVRAGLAEQLNAYFDKTFEEDTGEIDAIITRYEFETTAVIRTIDAILEKPPSLLDQSALTSQKKLLETHFEVNRQRLLEKKKEPSRSVALNPSRELLEGTSRILESANDAIAKHNEIVANLSDERKTLKDQIWQFVLAELKLDIATYDAKKAAVEKAIANIKSRIAEKEAAKRACEEDIRELERSITSIQPTVDAINGLLQSFGFNGFVLAQAENKRAYKLSRGDGTDAKQTLSEGERTFVTFLYFYHLLKGSAFESGMTADRVVVFDDPVSSLDSDILFIVSTLIRKVCEEVRAGTSNIKQVFVLTHNVYFHKEVTFDKRRGPGILNDETFWTVRKQKAESFVRKHLSNPIKSSYELLWLDVREPIRGNLSIQNSLRRILETYFKMLGGIDLDRVHEHFDGHDKLACRALLSWVNDGSHSAHDDLYVSVDEGTIDLYLVVFRKIFENQGHIQHYNMMMADSTVAVAAVTEPSNAVS
jgi:wobble nucleotide-excising tRNase